jgi:UTP--glucose-1-phosphate uridylyltransferase
VVNKAVIPAAGLGSRMLPITKAVPKEMLPVGEKPMIQLALEELSASGIKKIAIVIRQGKEIIKQYFTSYPRSDSKNRAIAELKKLTNSLEISFIYQRKSDGLGGALLAARDFIGDSPFVMLIPDQLVYAATPATRQLVGNYRSDIGSMWSSLVKIPKEEVPYFVGSGAFEFERINQQRVKIRRFLTEKETSSLYKKDPFEIRGIGRTILPPAFLDYLARERIDPKTGEIDYKEAVSSYTRNNPHYGVILEGNPFDLGSFAGYYHYLPLIWQLIIEHDLYSQRTN